ncbi:MAG TPA: SWIM zinc finger family protein [Anaerolineae bacterium]|nr:SWIM zinc finger family protein [Anaerolineae bacterium]
MDYAMISKIEKAKMYAEERERIEFESLRVRMEGDNNSHVVEYKEGEWSCDCTFFQSRSVCSHSMAMERLLRNMVELGGAEGQ